VRARRRGGLHRRDGGRRIVQSDVPLRGLFKTVWERGRRDRDASERGLKHWPHALVMLRAELFDENCFHVTLPLRARISARGLESPADRDLSKALDGEGSRRITQVLAFRFLTRYVICGKLPKLAERYDNRPQYGYSPRSSDMEGPQASPLADLGKKIW